MRKIGFGVSLSVVLFCGFLSGCSNSVKEYKLHSLAEMKEMRTSFNRTSARYLISVAYYIENEGVNKIDFLPENVFVSKDTAIKNKKTDVTVVIAYNFWQSYYSANIRTFSENDYKQWCKFVDQVKSDNKKLQSDQ